MIDFKNYEFQFVSKKLGIRVYLITELNRNPVLPTNIQIIEKRTGVFTVDILVISNNDYKNFYSFNDFIITYKGIIINHMLDIDFIEMRDKMIREEKLNKILSNK